MAQPEKRMRLRSSVSREEKEARKVDKEKVAKEELNKPFIEYKGKIKYCTDFIDCALVCDELISAADAAEDIFVVGFDMEWPFSFQTGPGKTALIQISPSLQVCFLLQVSALKNLPKGLNLFLSHPKTRITGNNIKNDVRKLHRDFAGIEVEKIIANCIDSGVMTNSILPFSQRWSMERLIGYLLKMKINKDTKVRKSKWHVWPLSKEQIEYAACDAYASLLIYLDLKRREEQNKQKEDDKKAENIQ